MKVRKSTFAVFFGNRGFFPASLHSQARKEMRKALRGMGHKVLMLDPGATRHGAVETPAEGAVFAEFLRAHRDEIDGVICCLPNFGDETGAVAAMADAGVPILVQAYPDELDKMAPAVRRDAFCGKFSVMDVFYQYGVKYTALQPHVVHPGSPEFAANMDYFSRLCQVVKGVKGMVVGAIGARTTAFKTVRIDELALQRHGITMETVDLSDVFVRMEKLKPSDGKVRAKARRLKGYSDCSGVPADALDKIVRLGVILDQVAEELSADAMAVRCWVEMQRHLGISCCLLLSEMNDRGLPVACEVDVGNAVVMHALSRASASVATCLDWNNNYADEADKCILFHCGPVPQSMMTARGEVVDHAILANADGVGPGCSYGCNVGRIAPTPFTYGSLMTEEGRLKFYLGEGRFTNDPIPEDFFGCAGVAEIPGLQGKLQTIGYQGHRHHTSVTPGQVMAPVREALEKYIGCEVTAL